MLQRPQTLLLTAAVVIMIISFFFPLWIYSGETGKVFLTALAIKFVPNNELTSIKVIPYPLITGIIAVLSVSFTITKYKNRILQMKLCSINNLFFAAYLLVVAVLVEPSAREFAESKGMNIGQFTFGFLAPAIAFICNFAAKWLINRDEKLVRSVDRIR